MKFKLLFTILFAALFVSCVDDKAATTDTESRPETESNEVKTTFIREPVDIVPSTGEDYPKSLLDLDFPILPNAEVTSVGNTDIENGTVVMQLETLASIDQIKKFFKKEMTARQWVEKEMKVYQGADNAISYRTKEYATRIMFIDDKIQDFRKIAITLNKRVKLEDFE